MNNKLIMLCIVLTFGSADIWTTHIINLFFRSYPDISEQQVTKYAQKIKQPGQLTKYSLKGASADPQVAGIFCTYAGYNTVSNLNGQVTFPNKQTKPIITLVIAPHLTPITLTGNTIRHFEIENGIPYNAFKAERKQDEDTEEYYWQVEPTILTNNIMPQDALFILARPDKVYVPAGITLALKSQNLLLPDIYVKKGIMKVAHALYMINLKQFFAPVKKEFKQEKSYYLELVN